MARMRRLARVGVLLGVVAILLSLFPLAQPARAGLIWCWWDPNFRIDGKRVDVYGLIPVDYLDRVPQGESILVTAVVNPRTDIQDVTVDYQLYTPDGQPTGIYSAVEIVRDRRIPRGLALFVVEVEGEEVPVRGEVWVEGTLTQVRYGTSDEPLILWAVVDPDRIGRWARLAGLLQELDHEDLLEEVLED